MKKNKLKKLSLKDHVLYIFVYIILFPFSFSLPFVILLRDNVLFGSPGVLSYSTGWGVLWCIPSMAITFAAIAYFGWSEKHVISVKQAIVGLFHRNKTRLIVVLCVILFLISFSLSLLSDWCEFRVDGLYTCNIFGVKEKIADIETVQGVKWYFDSAYISNGRYGSVQVSLSCEIQLDDKKISFDRFEPSNLLVMANVLKETPHEIVNGHLVEDWILEIDCEDTLRDELRKTFAS